MPEPSMSATFQCANAHCQRPLEIDHVTLVTTTHVRRFCSVECITEGHRAHTEELLSAAYDCPNCGHYLGDHIGTTGACGECLCQTTSRGEA